MCSECEWETWLAEAENLQTAIDEVCDTKSSDAAQDFCAGSEEKLLSMKEWVEESEHVTPKMESALSNMEAAVGRWL